jgi:hypothetical protein
MGAPPPRQSTLHADTLVQVTWQLPAHSASHVETLLHTIVLPGPAWTPQVATLSQS